jgi:hypothetical protein
LLYLSYNLFSFNYRNVEKITSIMKSKIKKPRKNKLRKRLKTFSQSKELNECKNRLFYDMLLKWTKWIVKFISSQNTRSAKKIPKRTSFTNCNFKSALCYSDRSSENDIVFVYTKRQCRISIQYIHSINLF